MAEFIKKYNKRIAVLLSLLMFTVASGFTSIYGLSKDITVEINERMTAQEDIQIDTITNANTNKTIREVLEENSFPVDENYDYSADLDTKIREIDTIEINKKVNGVLTSDGETVSYESAALTVGDLLGELEIRLAMSDIVQPSVDTALAADTSDIVIYRQTNERETREESIAYQTIQNEDPNLANGVVEIDIPGIEGRKLVTEDVKYRDGMAIARTVVEEELLLNPVNQIQRIGTGGATGSKGTSPGVVLTGYNGTSLSQEDYDLVCAIVEHEAGSTYESALAVMSCVMNRVDANGYGNNPVSVLTAPGQFASYLDGYYKQFLGNSSSVVRQAVNDCLSGKRSHNYLNFRSYKTTGSEKIGGNWFF